MVQEPKETLPAKPRSHWRGWRGVFISLAFLAALGLVWEGIVRAGIWPSYSLPSPATVLDRLWVGIKNNTIPIAIGSSMKRMIVGYAIAVVIGIVLGMVIARYELAERTIGLVVSGLQSLPSITWLPLALIWFGLNDRAIIFVVIMGSLLAVSQAAADGVRNIPPLYLRTARNLGASGPTLFIRVIFPASLPSLITGMKLGWAFAWRALMAAELLFITPGLGHLLEVGREFNDTARVIAVMAVIVFLGIVVDRLVFSPAEKVVRKRWGLTGLQA
ncbi:MAG: ABC transporter permease [Chloroflexi bacterium]|nr:ABC transporter permease [Chloroflexota bacterium]